MMFSSMLLLKLMLLFLVGVEGPTPMRVSDSNPSSMPVGSIASHQEVVKIEGKGCDSGQQIKKRGLRSTEVCGLHPIVRHDDRHQNQEGAFVLSRPLARLLLFSAPPPYYTTTPL